MKRLLVIFLLFSTLFLSGCTDSVEKKGLQDHNDQNEIITESENSSEIFFSSTVNDLGSLAEGEQVITYYKYKNLGNEPLLIRNIQAGCGCTVAKWNEAPLPPGDEADIKLVFNSSGKNGIQQIRITVISNAKNPRIDLILKAVVL